VDACSAQGFYASPEIPVNLPDRFEARGVIALGAMGQIYRAFDRQTNRLVSVKVFPPDTADSRAPARWQRVMEILKTLNHPAFIAILEAVAWDGGRGIIEPLIEGRTLAEQLERCGRMDSREAAALVAELAEALQLAHEHGLVHGSVMPSNILLGDDGRPRLLGMEEALLRGDRGRQHGILGNPTFLPPETFERTGNGDDPRRDVYGLGVVLYVALTNELPFSGRQAMEVIKQIVSARPKAPRRIVRSIPAVLESICQKAMAKDPNQRYSTTGAVAAALREFLKPRRRAGFWK
jgi:serine/threonine protein kinase